MTGREPRALLAAGAGALVVSGVAPHDRLTWMLESLPVLIAGQLLVTQGDRWDTQWDMLMALVGAATAQALLGRLHARQIARLEEHSHG